MLRLILCWQWLEAQENPAYEIRADTLIQQNTRYLLALSVWSTVNCAGSSDRISAQSGKYTTWGEDEKTLKEGLKEKPDIKNAVNKTENDRAEG